MKNIKCFIKDISEFKTIDRNLAKKANSLVNGDLFEEYPEMAYTEHRSSMLYQETITLLRKYIVDNEEESIKKDIPLLRKTLTKFEDYVSSIEEFSNNYDISEKLLDDAKEGLLLSLYVTTEIDGKHLVNLSKEKPLNAILNHFDKLDHLDNIDKIIKLRYELDKHVEETNDESIASLTNGVGDYAIFNVLNRGYVNSYSTILSDTLRRSKEEYKDIIRVMNVDDVGDLIDRLNTYMSKTSMLVFKILYLTISKEK